MGASERRELVSHLRTLLAHLLKWKYQTERRSESSWRTSIARSRQDLSEVLDDSATLRNRRSDHLTKAYKQARVLASTEMKLGRRNREKLFPKTCPWNFDEFMKEDFLPARPSGSNGRA